MQQGGGSNSEIRERGPEDGGIGLEGAVPLGGVGVVEVMAEPERLQLGLRVEVRDGDQGAGPEAGQEIGRPGPGPPAPDDRDQQAGLRLEPDGNIVDAQERSSAPPAARAATARLSKR